MASGAKSFCDPAVRVTGWGGKVRAEGPTQRGGEDQKTDSRVCENTEGECILAGKKVEYKQGPLKNQEKRDTLDLCRKLGQDSRGGARSHGPKHPGSGQSIPAGMEQRQEALVST